MGAFGRSHRWRWGLHTAAPRGFEGGVDDVSGILDLPASFLCVRRMNAVTLLGRVCYNGVEQVGNPTRGSDPSRGSWWVGIFPK